MWPFNSNKSPHHRIISTPPVEKLKAPDLSPAVPPKGLVFYVEPVRRFMGRIRESDPSPEYVWVYLFTENQAKVAKSVMEHPHMLMAGPLGQHGSSYPSVSVCQAYWLNDDPVETKKWINKAMHDCLIRKRYLDEEKARLESLTGFYPPKEM